MPGSKATACRRRHRACFERVGGEPERHVAAVVRTSGSLDPMHGGDEGSGSFRDRRFNAKQAAFWALLGGWLGLVVGLLVARHNASAGVLALAGIAGFVVVAGVVLVLFDRCRVLWQRGEVVAVGPVRQWTWDPAQTDAIVSRTLGQNLPRYVQLRTAGGRCVNIFGLPYDRRDLLYPILPIEVCRRSGFTRSGPRRAGVRWIVNYFKTGSDLDPDEGWKVVLLRKRTLGREHAVQSRNGLSETQARELAVAWLKDPGSA